MNLHIENHNVTPNTDSSLLDIIRSLNLTTESLATDPLAAKIAGRVFTLNYIPVRSKDITPDRTSIRTAMAASGGIGS